MSDGWADGSPEKVLAERDQLRAIDTAEQCCDYLTHEPDSSGRLHDFAEALRVVIDQLDHQRRRANWYETAHDAGKQKLIEHATAAIVAERDLFRATVERLERWCLSEASDADGVVDISDGLVRTIAERDRLRAEVDGQSALYAHLDSLFHLACDAAGIEDGSQIHRASLLLEMAKQDEPRTPLQRAEDEKERMRAVYEAAKACRRAADGDDEALEDAQGDLEMAVDAALAAERDGEGRP